MMRRSHPDHTDASFIRKGPSLNKLTTIATLSLIGLVGSPALAQTQGNGETEALPPISGDPVEIGRAPEREITSWAFAMRSGTSRKKGSTVARMLACS